MRSGRPGCLTNSCKFVTVSDQTAAVKRYPLTGIRARAFCEPLKFFAAFVHRSDLCSAILRHGWIFKRQAHTLMFGQSERLKRSQNPVFVNGLKLSDHNTLIVVPCSHQRNRSDQRENKEGKVQGVKRALEIYASRPLCR